LFFAVFNLCHVGAKITVMDVRNSAPKLLTTAELLEVTPTLEDHSYCINTRIFWMVAVFLLPPKESVVNTLLPILAALHLMLHQGLIVWD